MYLLFDVIICFFFICGSKKNDRKNKRDSILLIEEFNCLCDLM